MLVTLTALLTLLLVSPPQLRRLYMEQLKDDALRDASTIVRASESLATLFDAWSGSKLSRQEFDRLTGQRLDLIKKSSRSLSENPLVERVDQVKKPTASSRGSKSSESRDRLDLEEILPTLNAMAEKARLIRKQLEQLAGQPDSGPARPRAGPGRSTVTVKELQAPRIRDLCREIRIATERVEESFRSLGSRP